MNERRTHTEASAVPRGRVGIYGWGLVAPGAPDIGAFEELLRDGRTALRTVDTVELGHDLFAVGDVPFSFEDYAAWIGAREGEAYFARMKKKTGDNVRFAVAATIQALESNPSLEKVVREADDACHVYIGSAIGDLKEARTATLSLDHATRVWTEFWAHPDRCEARRRWRANGEPPRGAEAPPIDPATLAPDTVERSDALDRWNSYWAAQSAALSDFCARYAIIERYDGGADEGDNAPLDAIRQRVRAHRALIREFGCPEPPFSSVSANLIWNIQNAPSAQVTMLLGTHGSAWAPVGACSTFGVALKCGRDAILRGEAKVVIVGTTDPRPDPALAAAFHDARVMPASGDVNVPMTSLRGTHLAGGACVWILGDEDYLASRGLRPVGGWLAGVALSSDAEHIITPSKTGPHRAIRRAYAEAAIRPADVAVFDLHATGTPGDLNELAIAEDYVGAHTRMTARKGQFGHGMANSGGWELTALAMALAKREVSATNIPKGRLHPRVPHPEQIAVDLAPIRGDVGVKLMLGAGGISACVVLRASLQR